MAPAGSPFTSERHSPFQLGSFPIDQPRPIKVVVIGAGYSGITAAIRFRQRVQNLDLTVYDSNAGVGGTWYANRYPGLACDIPSHSYQLTFASKTDWSAFYAPGPEIRQYLESVVDKYQLKPYIKLQHRIVRAVYHEGTGKWNITIRRPKDGLPPKPVVGNLGKPDYRNWEEFQDTADVLFMGVGGLSRWSWPKINGLETFAGKVVHSAHWDPSETGEVQPWEDTVADWKEKKVAVIGLGSSAIQMVPALQPKVKHLVNYARGKTWISSTFVHDLIDKLTGESQDTENYVFTAKDKEAFKNPETYLDFKLDVERSLQTGHQATLLNTPLARLSRTDFTAYMKKKLEKKPWIAEHIIPDFEVACRRLTPGPGYLDALCEDNVDFVPTAIKEVKADGVETVDGKFWELDIIVCATGFDTTYKLDFSVVGRGGIDLNEHHNPHPRTYLAVAIDGFPNLFQSLGPNSSVGAGNLLIVMERQVDYAVEATLKIQRERIKSMEPKREAVEDFEQYIDAYFPRTAFGSKCKSWYKAGKDEGRVFALWPGFSLHAVKALEHPRWEDYRYEYLEGDKNRFYWFGDGTTVADVDPDVDVAWYLKPENIDYPPIPYSGGEAKASI